jgi:hypothetical protein
MTPRYCAPLTGVKRAVTFSVQSPSGQKKVPSNAKPLSYGNTRPRKRCEPPTFSRIWLPSSAWKTAQR